MAKNLSDMVGRFAKLTGGGMLGVGSIFGLGYLGFQSFYTVEGGHRALLFSRFKGLQPMIYTEGLHFRVPWFQWPIIYDIRARPRKISSPTGSKDLQTVNISLRILYRPDAAQLHQLCRQLGTDFDDRILPSITNEVLKSVVAKFNASQLITQRQQVSQLIERSLIDRARDFNVIVDDAALTELAFSREYTAAVELKQVAQQEAQRAQFIVERAKQERQQKVVQAEGEASAAKLIGSALAKNPGYLKLRKLRAAQGISRTISQSQNRVYLNAGSLMVNIGEKDFDSAAESLRDRR